VCETLDPPVLGLGAASGFQSSGWVTTQTKALPFVIAACLNHKTLKEFATRTDSGTATKNLQFRHHPAIYISKLL
jgi:hypothetical protein